MAAKKVVAPKEEAERTTVLNLKGSTEQREWLAKLSRKTLITSSMIARQALTEWAERRGHTPMPGYDFEE